MIGFAFLVALGGGVAAVRGIAFPIAVFGSSWSVTSIISIEITGVDHRWSLAMLRKLDFCCVLDVLVPQGLSCCDKDKPLSIDSKPQTVQESGTCRFGIIHVAGVDTDAQK